MIKSKPLSRAKKPTPLAPLIRGGLKTCLSPSLDKGRAGEGLAFVSAFLPYNKKLTDRARENRKNPTRAESKIWNEVLRMRQFADHKFLRQKPIDNYIVDFYCSELRLVIEIDGDSHVETVEYDAERTRVLHALGLTVVRYTNDDVINNIQGVYEDLSEKIDKLTPHYQGGRQAPSLIREGWVGCLIDAEADD